MANIVPAKAADLEAILAVMAKANQYSFDKTGEYQWRQYKKAQQNLTKDLMDGNCYIGKDDQDRVTAAVTITDQDTDRWGERGADQKALYVHKLMKDPELAGKHVASKFLSFAADQAIKQNKKYIRGDTKISLSRLLDYYKSLGFYEAGTHMFAATGAKAALLEIETTELIKNTQKIPK